MLNKIKNLTQELRFDIFVKEAAFFVLTQIIGLALIFRINHIPQLEQAIEQANISNNNPWSFLLSFLIVTIIFLLLLPLFKRKPLILKIFFFLGIVTGLDVVAGMFLGEPSALAISVLLTIILGIYPKVLTHNLLFSISLGGIGAVIAISLAPFSVALILGVLAIYDIVAVYLTKHMVKMAQVPASEGIFFGLIVPKDNQAFFENKPKIEAFGNKTSYYLLGGGDIVLPMILSASIANINFVYGIIVACFSFLGFIGLHLMFSSRKERKAMPGLPPLVFFTLLGYLVICLMGK